MKLTRYEKARIVGSRALQLSMGAPSLIKIKGDFAEPLTIALEELEAAVIPITVRRNMPARKETGEAAVPGKE